MCQMEYSYEEKSQEILMCFQSWLERDKSRQPSPKPWALIWVWEEGPARPRLLKKKSKPVTYHHKVVSQKLGGEDIKKMRMIK